jgi:hypothetical protein
MGFYLNLNKILIVLNNVIWIATYFNLLDPKESKSMGIRGIPGKNVYFRPPLLQYLQNHNQRTHEILLKIILFIKLTLPRLIWFA